MDNSILFSHLMDEYGNLEQERKIGGHVTVKVASNQDQEMLSGKPGTDLMQLEERNTGAVTWGIYARYLRYAGGLLWLPPILLLFAMTEGAQGIL
jgi:hypothetical protein